MATYQVSSIYNLIYEHAPRISYCRLRFVQLHCWMSEHKIRLEYSFQSGQDAKYSEHKSTESQETGFKLHIFSRTG